MYQEAGSFIIGYRQRAKGPNPSLSKTGQKSNGRGYLAILGAIFHGPDDEHPAATVMCCARATGVGKGAPQRHRQARLQPRHSSSPRVTRGAAAA